MNTPAPSHCQLVLAALSDGAWHSTASLYRECGGMILHSRIADLRRRGHTIEHRHVGGQGADAHEYRLIGQLAETPARVTASQEAADIHRYGHVAAWR